MRVIRNALKYNLLRQKYRRRVYLHFEDGDYCPKPKEINTARREMIKAC
jgi:hypothetical protein